MEERCCNQRSRSRGLMIMVTAFSLFSVLFPIRVVEALKHPQSRRPNTAGNNAMSLPSSAMPLEASVDLAPSLDTKTNGGGSSKTFGQVLALQEQSALPMAGQLLGTTDSVESLTAVNRVHYKGVPDDFQDAMSEKTVWSQLGRVSDVASFLCMIDCTVLPVLMIALPLLGLGTSPHQVHLMHEIGHKAALYFVVPTGALTSALSFVSHRRVILASVSALGLALIVCANSHIAASWGLLHQLHCGVLHRVVNVVGCSLVVGSHRVAKKLKGGCMSLLCMLRCSGTSRKTR